MNWFKNLKVGSKLVLSFTLLLVIAVIVGVFLISEMRKIENDYSEAMELSQRRMTLIVNAKDSYATAGMSMREIFYPHNTKDDLSRLSGQFNDSLNALSEHLTKLREITDGQLRNDIDIVLPEVEQYHRDGTDVISNLLAVGEVDIDAHDYRDAMEAGQEEMDRMSNAYVYAMSTSITEISVLALSEFDELIESNKAKADQDFLVAIILLIVMAILTSLVAIFIPPMITRPLLTLVAFMDKASSTGDLSLSEADHKVIGKYAAVKDEIGRVIGSCAAFVTHVTDIAKELETVAEGDFTVAIKVLSDADTIGGSLVRMIDNLSNMFNEINNTTVQVATGSKQIADGAQALAQGSTQQAASVQQLSASISDISLKTRDNAEKAEHAATLANTIKNNAEKGSKQMDEMIGAVRDISSASQSISKVIKVIDDIAFQTNILALNAAVEAARAGQHGKGFAVVAEEVRNLAAKSADAAKDTGGLIANSMEKAELGSRIAGETAESLTEIVQGISQSNQLVSEIAQSSNEQSAGITQINVGIDQVAQVIQQNSASAEESAAASEQMSSQANILEEMIAQLKLKDNGAFNQFAIEAPHKPAPADEKPFLDDNIGGLGKY